MSCLSKQNDVTTHNGEESYGLLSRVVLLPKFDNSSPSVTRDKEIYLSCDCEVMTSLPSEAEYPMEPFE